MAERISKDSRRHIMASVRGKDTKPEVALRKALFSLGYRYKLHAPELPGRPDIVLPRWRAVVLIDGCFWHRHGCLRSRAPATNVEYWQRKIERNVTRDRENIAALLAQEWRVCRIWTCAFDPDRKDITALLADQVSEWLKHGEAFKEFDSTWLRILPPDSCTGSAT